MSIEKGVALYTIELDGCLNGVYTNEGSDGVISNEILIPSDDFKKRKGDLILGNYIGRYFDNDLKKSYTEALEISLLSGKNNTYIFIWRGKNDTPKFTGVGFKMNNKQIVVRYEGK